MEVENATHNPTSANARDNVSLTHLHDGNKDRFMLAGR
jgi:hypothetical protein